MQIINSQVSIIDKVIGKQKYSNNENFRLLSYVKKLVVKDGILLYNVLTRCMVLLDENEYASILSISTLKDFWFVVPNDFQDKEFCNQLKKLTKLLLKNQQVRDSYVIFTTTDCNAHCFYCYERGRKRIHMSQKVAEDTANYIIKKSAGRNVYISWFGGEPLYNINAIDTISRLLNSSGIKFFSRTASNGYLFDDDVVNRCVNLWHLDAVQISLDGSEEIYNKTKAYIYKDVNPFEIVLNNIEKLLNAGVDVSIRLNVSSRNQLDLEKLVDIIHEKFANNEKLTIYSHALFESTGYKGDDTEESKEKNFISRNKIRTKIENYGYSKKIGIPNNLCLNHCMADNDSSYSINTTGNLGKCYLYSDNEFCGSIYKENIDQKVINRFKERVPEILECEKCCYYPDCISLKMCGDEKTCDKFWREERLYKIKSQMLGTYNLFLNKQQITEDENDEIEIQC